MSKENANTLSESSTFAKRTAKRYFEEISSFDLFYQLTYMSATAAAGISRARVFQLARQLENPFARCFESIHQVAEDLRYNYPEAVRFVGEQTNFEETKNFLLRLSDALRSGEPLAGFLAREAAAQGEAYSKDYLRRLESMKKWTDAYASVVVSVALIALIGMAATMMYTISPIVITGLVVAALVAVFGVAWVVFRAAPPEVKNVPLGRGSKKERLSRNLAMLLIPLAIAAAAFVNYQKLPVGWVLIAAGAVLLPAGFIAIIFDREIDRKDSEIGGFLHALGARAVWSGTPMKSVLGSITPEAFPALEEDIRRLQSRLDAPVEPRSCWTKLGEDSGSRQVKLSVGILYEAVNLGSDLEKAARLTEDFVQKTSPLRALRRGIAKSFSWLALVMHVVLTAVMVFLLAILEQFVKRLQDAMAGLGDDPGSAAASLGLGNMISFNTSQIEYLTLILLSLVLCLALVNAFTIVACEGSHPLKTLFYLAISLIASGMFYLAVPALVRLII